MAIVVSREVEEHRNRIVFRCVKADLSQELNFDKPENAQI